MLPVPWFRPEEPEVVWVVAIEPEPPLVQALGQTTGRS
jgi:hypothetical protein